MNNLYLVVINLGVSKDHEVNYINFKEQTEKCIEGQVTWLSFYIVEKITKQIGKLMHFDYCGQVTHYAIQK